MQPIDPLLDIEDATVLPLFGDVIWFGIDAICLAAFAPCTKYLSMSKGVSWDTKSEVTTELESNAIRNIGMAFRQALFKCE